MKPLTLSLLSAATLTFLASHRSFAAEQTTWKLDFGGDAAAGYTTIQPGAAFTTDAGFGFEDSSAVKGVVRGGADKLRDGFVTSDRPFLFWVAFPEGVYGVTATLGDAQNTSVTTVKAEARRLMLEKVETDKGTFATRTL